MGYKFIPQEGLVGGSVALQGDALGFVVHRHAVDEGAVQIKNIAAVYSIGDGDASTHDDALRMEVRG